MRKLSDRSKEVIINKKTLFGTARRWPWPLNRGGRLIEVVSLIIYNKYFWDFDIWPFNRGWPLNGGPLNRGSTVYAASCIVNTREEESVTSGLCQWIRNSLVNVEPYEVKDLLNTKDKVVPIVKAKRRPYHEMATRKGF